MSPRVRRLLVAIVSVALVRIIAAEAPAPPRGSQQRFAIFIGAEGPGIEVATQQRKLAELLRRDYGYRTENVTELYGEDATLPRIVQARDDLVFRLGRTDTLFIFIALPSVRMNDDLWAVPYGSNPAQPWTSLSTSDV